MNHVVELVPEYALDTLAATARRDVDAHLETCAACREELRSLANLLARLGHALPPAVPPTDLRRRLLAEVAGPERFAPFTSRVAELFDLPAAAAHALLREAAGDAGWEVAPMSAGSLLRHFEAGPGAGAFDAGFVRVAAGSSFPPHRHEGEEVTLVLAGGLLDAGQPGFLLPGELASLPAGSAHAFTAAPGEDLVFAVLLKGPVRF